MKKIAKLTALSLTAGMLLAACGDGTDTELDTEEETPGTVDPSDDDLETDGFEEDDDMENEDLDDDMEDDE